MITTQQVRSVLRTYSSQLRRRNNFYQEGLDSYQQPADLVSISIEARRKQMLSQMSNHLIAQVVQRNPGTSPDEGRSIDNQKQDLQEAGPVQKRGEE